MRTKRKFQLSKELNDCEEFNLSKIGGNLPKEPTKRHKRSRNPSVQDTEMEIMPSINGTHSDKSIPSFVSELISYRVGEDKV